MQQQKCVHACMLWYALFSSPKLNAQFNFLIKICQSSFVLIFSQFHFLFENHLVNLNLAQSSLGKGIKFVQMN